MRALHSCLMLLAWTCECAPQEEEEEEEAPKKKPKKAPKEKASKGGKEGEEGAPAKRGRKKKDPNAPKGALSAFMFYSNAMREKVCAHFVRWNCSSVRLGREALL